MIEKEPVATSEEGRFVKAFPLEFLKGVADLKQPQLRDDYTALEWLQHKLRYKNGHLVSSARAHRLIWAMFNTALLEVSRQMGRADHKATDSSVLTKRASRSLSISRRTSFANARALVRRFRQRLCSRSA